MTVTGGGGRVCKEEKITQIQGLFYLSYVNSCCCLWTGHLTSLSFLRQFNCLKRNYCFTREEKMFKYYMVICFSIDLAITAWKPVLLANIVFWLYEKREQTIFILFIMYASWKWNFFPRSISLAFQETTSSYSTVKRSRTP